MIGGHLEGRNSSQMSTTTTPNMGLVVPVVGSEPGPDYANEINAALAVIDSHDHSSGKGVKVTPDGLNINGDLTFNVNDATQLRSTRFTSQSTTLSDPGDVGCVYEVNGDLFYNNSAGTPVRVTSGNAVFAPAVANNQWVTTNVSSNTAISSGDTFTAVLVNTNSSPVTVTLPLAANVVPGRFFLVEDITGNANVNNMTVAASGSDTLAGAASQTVKQPNGGVFVVSDGVSKWALFRSGQVTYGTGETLLFTSGSTQTFSSSSLSTIFGATTNWTLNAGTIAVGPGVISTTFNATILTGSINAAVNQAIHATVAGGIRSEIAGGIRSAVSGGITLGGGASDWVTFVTSRTRTLWNTIAPIGDYSNWSKGNVSNFTGVPAITSTANSAQSILCNLPNLHDGANWNSVTVYFTVPNAHVSGVPANLPKIQVWQCSLAGSTPTLVSCGGGYQVFTPTPATGAAWQNSQNLQSIQYTLNGIIVDRASYNYFLEIVDESSTNAQTGNSYYGCKCIFGSITDSRFA